MKICILSDSHDNRQLLANAVSQAKEKGAEAVIHCGDVVAPSTLSVLKPFAIPMHVIHGNNTGDLYTMGRVAAKPSNYLHFYGQDAGIDLAGKKIFVVHYPHYARAMATTGEWDLVCCGHTHDASIESIANMHGEQTIFVNPGSVGGIDAPPTYVMADLDRMEFEIVGVE